MAQKRYTTVIIDVKLRKSEPITQTHRHFKQTGSDFRSRVFGYSALSKS